MSYENSNPITDKFNFPDGSIRQLDGTIVQQPNDFNEQRYNQSEPIPNKFLHADGSVKDKDGNVIEQSSEFNVKRYSQAVPIPAKFLHEDGTIDENIGGGTSLQYKLYAWEVSIDHTTIGYTEIEDVEAGDVLLIPENTGAGPITNTNQLKKKGLVKSVSGNHITVEIEEDSEVVFERDSENDWTETITDVKGTLDVSQGGLLVAEKGKVMKALDIIAGGGSDTVALYAFYRRNADYYVEYCYALKPLASSPTERTPEDLNIGDTVLLIEYGQQSFNGSAKRVESWGPGPAFGISINGEISYFSASPENNVVIGSPSGNKELTVTYGGSEYKYKTESDVPDDFISLEDDIDSDIAIFIFGRELIPGEDYIEVACDGESETKKAYISSGPGSNRTSIKYDTFERAVGDYTIVSMRLNGVLYDTAITPIQLHLEFEP